MRSPVRSRRTARLTAAGAALVLMLAAAGCGIPLDSTARWPVRVQSKPVPSANAAAGDTTVLLYYVRNDQVAATTRNLSDRSVAAALTALLQPPSKAETAAGLVSQIPAGTRLRGIQLRDDNLIINLSKDFADVIGSSGQEAAAEVVLTATGVANVGTVAFQVDGTPIKVSSPSRGDVNSVTDCDFLPLFPTVDQQQAAHVSGPAASHLATQRRTLLSNCPSSAPGP